MTAAIYFLGACILLHAIINFVRSKMWYDLKVDTVDHADDPLWEISESDGL